MKMHKILIINGSYRENGITDQTIHVMNEALLSEGVEVEVIILREYPIAFCLNCRECTQEIGVAPMKCVQDDNMSQLIDKIEEADGYIFIAPTNFGSVTAIFKRFMERLVVYAYWSWGVNAPTYRKENVAQKRAIIVSSCVAPGMMGCIFFDSHKELKLTAKTVGAKIIGKLFIGMIANEEHPLLSSSVEREAIKLAKRLIK